MPLDYEKIREINKGLYGTEVANYGKLFFEDMYADRTHFIFEMLQNAEDAIARRGREWNGSRQVKFHLEPERLIVEHFGDPFNEEDVKGICSINRSNKKDSLTDIGRFGIGFKSVYAFTARPEIHSGGEHFAIENYVWPVGIPLRPEEDSKATRFVLPFKNDTSRAHPEIEEGLRRLGADSLLFLQHIEEIEWVNDSGISGHYLRQAENLDEGVQHVIVVAEESGNKDVHMEWLVFSRPVDQKGQPAGQVNIAFSLEPKSGDFRIEQNSRLFVFFPTHMETHFGVRMNGSYRTTTNRENVPHHDSWNRRLVIETAKLLERSLRWLRDSGRLDIASLRCLPISQFSSNLFRDEDDLLDPLFARTEEVLSSEPLLPRLGGGYVSAKRALIGRTAGIRNLLTAEQISEIYGSAELSWLSDGVSQDATLSRYLISHLGVEEVRPEDIIRRLSKPFLEKQSDEWIKKLYEFLQGQPALAYLYGNLPLVRLESGYHVTAKVGEYPQAYLPTENTTGFPTAAASVCSTPRALTFLRSLGISEPDLVDDVLQNILPTYRGHDIAVPDREYEKDIRRIVRAFENSTGPKRQRLMSVLRGSNFIKLTDASGRGTNIWGSPEQAYLPTENLQGLFEGVSGVRFVDTSVECLDEENISEVLKACGTDSQLSAVTFQNRDRFTRPELGQMRYGVQSAYGSNREEKVTDVTIRGLSLLLRHLPCLDPADRAVRAELLWDALRELNPVHFTGAYSWFYYTEKSKQFDAVFVEELKTTPWIPSDGGSLACPECVAFDDLGWEEDSFLQSKIPFKASTLVVLAEEAGVELGVLAELKRRGIETVSDLLDVIGDIEYEEPATPTAASGEPHTNSNDAEHDGSFARDLQDAMTLSPFDGPTNPFIPPPSGPNTDESVASDSRKSALEGRGGRQINEQVSRFELSDTGQELEQYFKSMLQGDYGKRCQICGAAFLTPRGEFQMFADHIVSPSKNSLTNHPGNLLSLCGWHYALISHGQWVLLDAKSGDPIEGPGEDIWLEHILKAPEDYDEEGNLYRSVPIRFWNVYPEWTPHPETIDEKIRFSIPHWKYLCELLRA